MKHVFTLTAILFSIFTYAQNITDSFMVDGVYRNYILHIPQGYNASTNYPLVLNLHGYTSNAAQQMQYTKMNTTADAEHFFVVYPNGIDNAWNSFGNSPVDDVNFLSQLIDRIRTSYSIDSNAVFSCGMSNGGFMSYTLACQLSEKIAAVASVTGTLSLSSQLNCAITHKMPVMNIHGTTDPTVNYNGFTGALGVEATVAFWRDTNSCGTISDTINVPNTNTADNSTAELIRYRECAENSEVYFYKITNGGHTWPNGLIDIPLYGNTNRDFDATTEIWNFFKRHKKGQQSSSINNVNDFSATIFPNPFNNALTIHFADELPTELTVFDITGKQVFGEENMKSTTNINSQNWNTGIYIAVLKNKNGVYISRIVKQ